MPRTVHNILTHADELAKRFERYEPSPEDERDPESFAALRQAVLSRSDAERSVKDAVNKARQHGYSWHPRLVFTQVVTLTARCCLLQTSAVG